MRVAINGFGRIGKLIFREYLSGKYKDIEIVAINDSSCAKVAAHLLKYDSIHGILRDNVQYSENELIIDDRHYRYTSKKEPSEIALDDVDLVLECTGKYKSKEKCQAYFNAGCKRILISAPGEGVDLTVVYGVNDDQIQSCHKVLSNASCTTNCLAPLVKVINRSIGIKYGHMLTVHSYTGDQRLVDMGHTDLRRARAAASSMIPTSTGAAKAIGLIFPELAGKLHGSAVRVPVQDVSFIDFSFISRTNTSKEDINNLMLEASNTDLKGILGYNDLPLVSSDFKTTRFSSIFDATQTNVTEENLCTISGWYDNEYAFACRMLDVAEKIDLLRNEQ